MSHRLVIALALLLALGPALAPVASSGESARAGSRQGYEGSADDASVDLDAFWRRLFAGAGLPYVSPTIVALDAPTATGCGAFDPLAGPGMYCGAERTVYVSAPWYRDLVAGGVDFAWVTVVAHEWGHHVQYLLGVQSVGGNVVELQADCLAGAYAQDAAARGLLDSGDVTEAVGMSAGSGDPAWLPQDRPGAHGTNDDRITAFMRGYLGGVADCELLIEAAPVPPAPAAMAPKRAADVPSAAPAPSRTAWVPDGTLAYAAETDGQWDLYAYDFGTGASSKLTASPDDNEVAPSWSHTGDALAYVSDTDGSAQVWVMDADGSNPTQMTFGVAGIGYVAWAADDASLVVSAADPAFGGRLALVPRGGGAAAPFGPERASLAAVAADGRMAYETRAEGAASEDFDVAVWSPGDTSTTLADTPEPEEAPSISPDGEWVAYQVGERGARSVEIVPSSGGGARPLPRVGDDDSNPVWSPDGAAVALVANRGGRDEVWVVPLDGGKARPVDLGTLSAVWYLAWDGGAAPTPGSAPESPPTGPQTTPRTSLTAPSPPTPAAAAASAPTATGAPLPLPTTPPTPLGGEGCQAVLAWWEDTRARLGAVDEFLDALGPMALDDSFVPPVETSRLYAERLAALAEEQRAAGPPPAAIEANEVAAQVLAGFAEAARYYVVAVEGPSALQKSAPRVAWGSLNASIVAYAGLDEAVQPLAEQCPG